MKCSQQVVPTLVAAMLGSLAFAQEMPTPAPELQKLAPLIGSWGGSGTAQMGPGEPSKWDSRSTYSWTLGKFFVQEDTVVRFNGMPDPLVLRCYLGWDPATRSYVSADIDNDGHVGVNRIEIPEDGAVVKLAQRVQDGQIYLERYTSRVHGDTLEYSIDMMGSAGDPMQLVKGTLRRVDESAPKALAAGRFTAAPNAGVLRLGKTAGTFDVKAKMIMVPGTPAMEITGVDTVKPLFGGNVVHVHTTGVAEGQPDEYVGELFYGFDERRNGIVALYLSNMGEVGEMMGSFSDDHRQFILTSSAPYMGQPCSQRMVMQLDANGAPESAVGHCLLGSTEPYESWTATYKKR